MSSTETALALVDVDDVPELRNASQTISPTTTASAITAPARKRGFRSCARESGFGIICSLMRSERPKNRLSVSQWNGLF